MLSQADRHAGSHTDRQTDRLKDRKPDGQTGRQTESQNGKAAKEPALVISIKNKDFLLLDGIRPL